MRPMRKCRRKVTGTGTILNESLADLKEVNIAIIKTGKTFYRFLHGGPIFYNKAKADAYAAATGREYWAMNTVKLLCHYGD